MVLKRIVSLSNLTLLVALSLSTVAAYYSIIGLIAIFAGAVIPIIVMGSILEIGKITTTVWLRKYWHNCSWLLKIYLVPAVILLALLTSMGIFGFLSKAHMDQGIVTGDSQAKLALYDEKIKTQRDNIEIARKALQQMDAQVDARLSRSDNEQGAERAVQIRRQQATERVKLQKEISDAQKEITKLNEERAPIAAENRKIEAEVGPVKYIAALIYGDNPDQNILEKSVRWVIILLVIVFDPLAIALVLAANASKGWDISIDNLEKQRIEDVPTIAHSEDLTIGNCLKCGTPLISATGIGPFCPNTLCEIADNQSLSFIEPNDKVEDNKEEKIETPIPITKKKKRIISTIKKSKSKIKNSKEEKKEEPKIIEPEPIQIIEPIISTTDPDIITEGVTTSAPWQELPNGWIKYEGKTMQKDALKKLQPELFAVADSTSMVKTNFGPSFPKISNRSDIFVRTDIVPNRVFKFDGSKWIEVSKDQSSSYLSNTNYVQFLINKIYSGEYDVELLTDEEKSRITEFVKNT